MQFGFTLKPDHSIERTVALTRQMLLDGVGALQPADRREAGVPLVAVSLERPHDRGDFDGGGWAHGRQCGAAVAAAPVGVVGLELIGFGEDLRRVRARAQRRDDGCGFFTHGAA